LRDTLASLDLITRDKMLIFRQAIKDLLKTETEILPRNSDKKAVIINLEDDEKVNNNK